MMKAPMISDQAYAKLKSMIYEGRLHPGQRLLEVELSKALSVSRIPLRECLVRLESEGLVRRVPNSATFVEDFSRVDILEMYSMRMVLEPLSACLAASTADAAFIAGLHDLCEEMTQHTKTEDWAKLDRADYQFHYTIVKASEHQRLIRSYENCHIQITGFRAGYSNLKKSSLDGTAQEHLRIVKCIEQHDAKGAEEAAYNHVATALHYIEDRLGIRLQDLSGLRTMRSPANDGAEKAKNPRATRNKKGQWTLT